MLVDESFGFYFRFGAAAVLGAVLTLASRQYFRRYPPRKRFLSEARVDVVLIIGVSMLLLFELPSSSVSAPASVEELSPSPELLRMLQEETRALSRTIDVLFFYVFVMTWWLVAGLERMARAFALQGGEAPPESTSETAAASQDGRGP